MRPRISRDRRPGESGEYESSEMARPETAGRRYPGRGTGPTGSRSLRRGSSQGTCSPPSVPNATALSPTMGLDNGGAWASAREPWAPPLLPVPVGPCPPGGHRRRPAPRTTRESSPDRYAPDPRTRDIARPVTTLAATAAIADPGNDRSTAPARHESDLAFGTDGAASTCPGRARVAGTRSPSAPAPRPHIPRPASPPAPFPAYPTLPLAISRVPESSPLAIPRVPTPRHFPRPRAPALATSATDHPSRPGANARRARPVSRRRPPRLC